jgi:hypothetical protein
MPSCDFVEPAFRTQSDGSLDVLDLNGVPLADGGNRASAAGAPYAVVVEVATDAEEEQSVALTARAGLSGSGPETRQTASVRSGLARIDLVTLEPDGFFRLRATCTNQAGGRGQSLEAQVLVNTTLPDMTVLKPTAGQALQPDDIVAGRFEVRIQTVALDAMRPFGFVNGELGRLMNLCAAAGDGAAVCATVDEIPDNFQPGVAVEGAVSVPCPAAAGTFTVSIALEDVAHNVTRGSVDGVSCPP